jgi:hypothetical protein
VVGSIVQCAVSGIVHSVDRNRPPWNAPSPTPLRLSPFPFWWPDVAVGPVTTDHIAPAGSTVSKNLPGQYLMDFLRYQLPRSDVGGRSGGWRSPCEAWWIPWRNRLWELVRMAGGSRSSDPTFTN